MSITYRKELHLTCDYDTCSNELILDQLDGGYRCGPKRLRKIALEHGWQIVNKQCFCRQHQNRSNSGGNCTCGGRKPRVGETISRA